MLKIRQRVVIVGGGNITTSTLADIRESDYVIGVDRGAYWLILNRIIPDIAIGDFDSVTAREVQIIKKQSKRMDIYPKKKNKTDMELAIDHAISLQPKEVTIYGAIGDRLDHTLANIYQLEQVNDAGILGIIIDETNEVRIVDKFLTIKKDSRFRYISIVPVAESILVTLTGFAYDLSHAIIRRGQTIGISNEIRGDEATIEIHQGKALVTRSRD